VIKQFLQNLIDDELHLLMFDVKGEGDAKTKCCAVIRRDYRHRGVPLPESMDVTDVESDQYLSSSIDPPDLVPGTEVVLLRRSGKAVAVASKRNGCIVAWSSLENASDARLADDQSVQVTSKTFIGLISVDGKMGATVEGHQGQGCVSPCYGCTALTALMTGGQNSSNIASESATDACFDLPARRASTSTCTGRCTIFRETFNTLTRFLSTN